MVVPMEQGWTLRLREAKWPPGLTQPRGGFPILHPRIPSRHGLPVGHPLQISHRALASPTPTPLVTPGAQHPQCFVLLFGSPSHDRSPPPAASPAAASPGGTAKPSRQLLSSPGGSQRERQQLPWHTPASGPPRVPRHRPGPQGRPRPRPPAGKGGRWGNPALLTTKQETEAGGQPGLL